MTEFKLEMDNLSGQTWEAFTVRLIIRLCMRTENKRAILAVELHESAWSVYKDELIFLDA